MIGRSHTFSMGLTSLKIWLQHWARRMTRGVSHLLRNLASTCHQPIHSASSFHLNVITWRLAVVVFLGCTCYHSSPASVKDHNNKFLSSKGLQKRFLLSVCCEAQNTTSLDDAKEFSNQTKSMCVNSLICCSAMTVSVVKWVWISSAASLLIVSLAFYIGN